MAERITAENAATLGLESLLGVIELLEHPRKSEITLASRKKENAMLAQKVALGVDHMQDALWKKGLDCRCTAPPGVGVEQRRGLDWICSCEPRGQTKKRRKLMKAISEMRQTGTG